MGMILDLHARDDMIPNQRIVRTIVSVYVVSGPRKGGIQRINHNVSNSIVRFRNGYVPGV